MARVRGEGRRLLRIEQLEQRALLSATAVCNPIIYIPIQAGGSGITPDATSPPSGAFTPSQIQTAYGISSINIGGVAGTGAGQTIAIIDAYNDPNIISDAATFNTQFGLQQFNVSGGPTLTVLNETGGTSLPGNAAKGSTSWSVEEIARRAVGPFDRPPGQHHPLRGQQHFVDRPAGRGADGRDQFRRLRGFDELGRRRILRRDFLRLVFHVAQQQRDLSGIHGR